MATPTNENLERAIRIAAPGTVTVAIRNGRILSWSGEGEQPTPEQISAALETLAAVEPERERIRSGLAEIDRQSIRALRAVAAGTAVQADHDRLADLDAQAQDLRDELAALDE